MQPDDPTVAARISACLTDMSCWMKDHYLQLNLVKTELLVVLGQLNTSSQFLHVAGLIIHNSIKVS